MAAKQTRGRLLGAGAAAIGGAALAPAAAAATQGAETVVEGAFGPDFTGDVFFLQLDGASSGSVTGPTGGEPVADVVTEQLGPDYYVKKHLGNVKYNDFKVQMAMGTNRPLFDWIQTSWNQNFTRKSGAIQAADFNLRVQAVGSFTDTLLSEVTIPALDGSSKEAAPLTVTLTPSSTIVQKVEGGDIESAAVSRTITWKLEVDGLDTSSVTNIDSFTVTQSAATGNQPATIDFPDLSVWLDPAGASTWIDWFDDFVGNGDSGDDQERSGALRFYDEKQVELAHLGFEHLGIFKLTPEKVEAGSENIRRVKAELYVEEISFTYGPGTWT